MGDSIIEIQTGMNPYQIHDLTARIADLERRLEETQEENAMLTRLVKLSPETCENSSPAMAIQATREADMRTRAAEHRAQTAEAELAKLRECVIQCGEAVLVEGNWRDLPDMALRSIAKYVRENADELTRHKAFERAVMGWFLDQKNKCGCAACRYTAEQLEAAHRKYLEEKP